MGVDVMGLGDILVFIFNLIKIVYVLFVALCMWRTYIFLKFAKAPLWSQILAPLAICSIFIGWPIINQVKNNQKQKQDHQKYNKLVDAQFQILCKNSGIKIYHTADTVDGVLLMKLRPKWNPYDLNQVDPYGRDYSIDDNYISSFLWGRNSDGQLVENQTKAARPGYRYVDVIESDGKRYRYTASMGILPNFPNRIEPSFILKRTRAKGPAPRYGITYDDITSPEERERLIAGSSLKIIDLKTNQIIAERIGYMIDRGINKSGSGGLSWNRSVRWACPEFPGTESPNQMGQTRNFTEQVLKIKGR